MFEEVTVEYNRYTYYFDDEINQESVQGLIDVLVGIPNVDLFFCTVGGELPAMRALIHFINNHPDIKIYLTAYVASAGTFLLTDCTSEIYLTEDLEWMLFHMGDREFGGRFRKEHINADILYEQLKDKNKEQAEKYKKLGLTTKEIKDYMKGEDVILYKKDFKRLKVSQK